VNVDANEIEHLPCAFIEGTSMSLMLQLGCALLQSPISKVGLVIKTAVKIYSLSCDAKLHGPERWNNCIELITQNSSRCSYFRLDVAEVIRQSYMMSLPTTTSESFTLDSLPRVTYGFIGIGVMGWGMAQNLRVKIPQSSALVICELVEARREKFVAEVEGLIEVAKSPREVAERAASINLSYSLISNIILGRNNYNAAQRHSRPRCLYKPSYWFAVCPDVWLRETIYWMLHH
jgi:hypothetical protein